jgi:hypothetical protein
MEKILLRLDQDQGFLIRPMQNQQEVVLSPMAQHQKKTVPQMEKTPMQTHRPSQTLNT